MKTELDYYQVNGGAVKVALDKFFELRNTQYAARQELTKEFCADGLYGSARGLTGMVFKDVVKVPAGWKPVSGMANTFQPDYRTKEGRKLKARLKTYILANYRKLQEFVLGEDNPFHFCNSTTMQMNFMGCERIGEVVVLMVPIVPKKVRENEGVSEPGGQIGEGTWSPPDEGTVRLKQSEYWKLKEDLAAGQGAAAT